MIYPSKIHKLNSDFFTEGHPLRPLDVSSAKKQSTTPKAKTASARKATKKSATKSQCEKPDEHRSHAGPPKSLDVNRASHGSGQALPALSRLIVYTTLE